MSDSKLTVPQSYAELRQAVKVAMVQGQQAVEQAKVRTYWETGRLIDAHFLANQSRTNYGGWKARPRPTSSPTPPTCSRWWTATPSGCRSGSPEISS